MSTLYEAYAAELRDGGQVKTAKIMGESVPHETLTEASVPYEQRRRAYELYLQRKSEEQPSSALAAMGGGAAIGGGLGALAGIPAGPPGMAVGGGRRHQQML